MSSAAPAASRLAIRGDLLDFSADPGFAPPHEATGVRLRSNHWLLVDAGRIVAVQADAPDPSFTRHVHAGALILPGFIDTHVHSPQLEVVASHGADLLKWLSSYTFPAELRHADPAFAAASAAAFCDSLLAHGTTAACVFPTVHKTSADALFAAAFERGMRVIAGKCLMDRNAPAGLTDTVASAERDSLDLIARWHGRGRLAYAHTVRFAPTSTPAQLALAGALLAAHPGTYMQTHVAENRDELRWVAELFPESRSYLGVYDAHRLLGPRSVLAHGIWLDAEDHVRLSASGAQIAHCPSSNLFLGSGLMDWQALHHAGVPVSLGSDVGGGTSLSMQRTLADAYRVAALRGVKLSAWTLLHAATRGAAQSLQLGGEIGSFEPGTLADIAVWQWAATPVAKQRDAVSRDLHDRVFAWMMLSDERNLVATYVAGERVMKGV